MFDYFLILILTTFNIYMGRKVAVRCLEIWRERHEHKERDQNSDY